MKRLVVLTCVLAASCGGSPPAATAPRPREQAATNVLPTPNGEVAARSATHRAPRAPIALEEYYKILRTPALSRSGLAMVSVSHDEKLVAYASDASGRIELWVKPIGDAGPGKQITHTDGFIHSLAFSPTADVLVYEADRGGDELPRLYATDASGTAPRELVPELPVGRRTQFVEWAENGKSFLYLSSARDAKYLDLLEYDLATKRSSLLWQASGKLAFELASRDHKKFAIVETHSDADNDVHVMERGAKAPILLTKHEGAALFHPQDFSKDKKTLHLTADVGGEFTELFAIDLATKERRPVFKDSWDVERAFASTTFKYFLITTNEDGATKAQVREVASSRSVPLPPAPGKSSWLPLSFSRSDRYLTAATQGDETPTSIYVIDLASNVATPVADVLPPSLRDHAMTQSEAVRIPSFDGREVPAFLFRPRGTGPFPAIIDVHGGPTAQSRHTFAAHRQYFASKGYAVLVPNVRGSTGYGKTYTKLDNLDLGGGPLQDILACKKWLVRSANVRADKVVVMGGSYGGYMALAAEAFLPDEFAANVDFFGVSDLKTLVESFPPYWASQSAFIFQKFGDPKNPSHAKYQHDRSPIHFVDAMKRPLLVVQGEKDPRVKQDQSDRIVQGLKRRRVPVHYLLLSNEGHGFTNTESVLRAYALTDRFLDRYVFEDETRIDLP